MNNIVIQKVPATEAVTLLNLSRQTFFDAFADKNSPEDMATYATHNFTGAKIAAELNTPHSCFYFVWLGNEIIGYLKLNTLDAQTEFKHPHATEIERIYILSNHQGKQYGEALLNYAIAFAKEAKHQYIWLGVWDKNYSAIRFYERHGFKIFSSHYFMLGNDKQTDILMRLDLV